MPSFHPLLVVLPLVLVACEAEPGSDDTSGDTQEETNGDTLPPYRYVRIDDEGPLDEDGSSPGADIDAIELQQASSEPASYAVSVAASNVDSTLREQDEDYILGAWQLVDLRPLGRVVGLFFDLSSTDEGDWGMNTPAYFALDNLDVLSATP